MNLNIFPPIILKYKNEIYNFIGGACQQDKKFHYDDISSVLDYVKNRYECTDNKKTTRKIKGF